MPIPMPIPISDSVDVDTIEGGIERLQVGRSGRFFGVARVMAGREQVALLGRSPVTTFAIVIAVARMRVLVAARITNRIRRGGARMRFVQPVACNSSENPRENSKSVVTCPFDSQSRDALLDAETTGRRHPVSDQKLCTIIRCCCCRHSTGKQHAHLGHVCSALRCSYHQIGLSGQKTLDETLGDLLVTGEGAVGRAISSASTATGRVSLPLSMNHAL